jgi:tetratricopeptide (TPR) repeat protein
LILKAIDKSEDNIAEYYFIKAVIYCQSGNFE